MERVGGDIMVQVSKDNYAFDRYVLQDRWLSYYYQIKEATSLMEGEICQSYLIIGAGDSIVPDVIKRVVLNTIGGVDEEQILVDTFDFDSSLLPTYEGDLREIARIVKKKYDCIICCQVLEHLPYDQFEGILRQLKGICNRRFILSLPQHRLPFVIDVETPWFRKALRCYIEKSWVKSIPWNGQHYWEVGIRGHRRRDIVEVVSKYFDVERRYVAFGNSYHFFVISKKREDRKVN